MKIFSSLFLVFALATTVFAVDPKLSQHLQDVSVTVEINDSLGNKRGEGSGVLVTREVDGEKVSFVWTAGHVVDSLRKTRDVVDPKSGTKRTVVEFDDANIVKILVENGRKVGESKMAARVVKFSDADNGEDLALLEIYKKNFSNDSAEFYLNNEIPPLGTHFYHVGSLLGNMGANSMTDGILSQVGRLINNKVYDQSTIVAFPGCVTAETRILMADNTTKNVVDIKKEENVVCMDDSGHKTVGQVLQLIDSGFKNIYNIQVGDKLLRVSGNHPIAVYTTEGPRWVRADEITEYDWVIVENTKIDNFNSYAKINNISIGPMEKTYDLVVDTYHNFFANGFLVHNSSGGGVFLAGKPHNAEELEGKYVGMLVRGTQQQGFNLIVPARRMRAWAKRTNIEWALDPTIAAPTRSELDDLVVEDIGKAFNEADIERVNTGKEEKNSFGQFIRNAALNKLREEGFRTMEKIYE